MTQECYIWLFRKSMIAASKYIMVSALLILMGSVSFAQKGSDRLKKEQQQLEQQIATTKSLVTASREKTQLSYEEVQLIEKQIRYREQLLNNIDNQIRASELKIKQKNQTIHQLELQIEKLKNQYAELLLYAYKRRNKYGDLMYIFSAPSVEEALKRKLYLEKLGEIQKKQLRLIQQNRVLLEEEIAQLAVEKENKLKLADQKRIERKEILIAKKEKEEVYLKFKQKEQKVLAELKLQEQKNLELQKKIQAAIQKEIAEEQARLEKIRKEKEAKRKAEEARKAKEKGEVVTVAPPDKTKDDAPIPFITTKEAALAGANFSSNRGRLPWPVEKGTITQDYGKNAHPTLNNVYTQNNGIDISTPKNAVVRAIFDGEVTSVINIPGAGKVIILKHGNYRSVYSNIQDAYVTKGSIVSIKSPLGSLLPNKEGSLSVAHFEIHEVKDGKVKQLNPNLWIAK